MNWKTNQLNASNEDDNQIRYSKQLPNYTGENNEDDDDENIILTFMKTMSVS